MAKVSTRPVLGSITCPFSLLTNVQHGAAVKLQSNGRVKYVHCDKCGVMNLTGAGVQAIITNAMTPLDPVQRVEAAEDLAAVVREDSINAAKKAKREKSQTVIANDDKKNEDTGLLSSIGNFLFGGDDESE